MSYIRTLFYVTILLLVFYLSTMMPIHLGMQIMYWKMNILVGIYANLVSTYLYVYMTSTRFTASTKSWERIIIYGNPILLCIFFLFLHTLLFVVCRNNFAFFILNYSKVIYTIVNVYLCKFDGELAWIEIDLKMRWK